jgi:cbb3-type cytochrome oxidase maturation protein
MDSLYVLLPLSVLLGFLVLGVLGWAIHRGQFEHLDQEGLRILDDGAALPDVSPDGNEGNTPHKT